MNRNTLLVLSLIISIMSFPLSAIAGSKVLSSDDMLVVLLSSDLNGVILEMEAPSYEIIEGVIREKVIHQVVVPRAAQSADPEFPQLPVKSVILGVPPEAEIELEIVKNESEMLSGEFLIPYPPKPMPVQQDLEPGRFSVPELPTLHKHPGNNDYFPSVPAVITDEGWLRDQRIVRVEFYPFQYSTSDGSLIWNRYLKVQVRFHNPADQTQSTEKIDYQENQYFEPIYKSFLLNYESARSWRGFPRLSSYSSIKPQFFSQNQSVNSTELSFYKIVVDHDSIYQLTYEALTEAAEVPIEGVEPGMIRMTNQGREVAIEVHASEGTFGSGDYITFYGQKFYGDYLANKYEGEDDHWITYDSQDTNGGYMPWAPEFNATMMEKYTDENVYWLIIGDDSGLSMESHAPPVGESQPVTSFRDTVHAEEEHEWRTTLFVGEDTMYWEKITTSDLVILPYTISLPYPADISQNAVVRGEIVAATYNNNQSPDHHIKIYINGPSNETAVVDQTWDGKSRFLFEGLLPQSQLVAGENVLDLWVEKTQALSVETLYVNWFEIEYEREFQAVDGRLEFTNDPTDIWKYEIGGFSGVNSNDIGVYDISDPLVPETVLYAEKFPGGTVRFESKNDGVQGKRFFVGVPEQINSGKIFNHDPVDLDTSAEYIIITHKDLWDESVRLADYRASKDLSTLVLDIEDIYNEFNYGIFHPIAIKNFIKYTFDNWEQPPVYVLLVGDGHWNFKGAPDYDAPQIYMPPNLVWVDPWQGEVDSANLLAAVQGDDPLADLHIARIPVNSEQELEAVVDKIIAYEESEIEDWQSRFLFVADDKDAAGDFARSSEEVIKNYRSYGFAPVRVYLDDYLENGTCESDGSRGCTYATQVILYELNDYGALFLTYHGHASLNRWSNESLFINDDIHLLDNMDTLPVILSFACLDGYWIHPNMEGTDEGQGLIESILRAEQRGAVAAFSPTGLGVGTGHDILQEGFYDAYFYDEVRVLGPLSLAAKLNLYSTGLHKDLLHTFAVFGDPALRIDFPDITFHYLPSVYR